MGRQAHSFTESTLRLARARARVSVKSVKIGCHSSAKLVPPDGEGEGRAVTRAADSLAPSERSRAKTKGKPIFLFSDSMAQSAHAHKENASLTADLEFGCLTVPLPAVQWMWGLTFLAAGSLFLQSGIHHR